MKILYISHASALSQGSVKALISIVTAMKKSGCDVAVLFPKDGEAIKICKKNDIRAEIIPFFASTYPSCKTFRSKITFLYHLIRDNIITNYRASLFLDKLIDSFKPDIIHTNVGVINIGLHAAKRKSIPHVWHIRENAEGFYSYKPFPSFSYKMRLLKENDANIAITKDIFNTYNMSRDNSYVVYDGVFNIENVPDINMNKKKYFLFVGALIKNKGIDWAINAFMKIKDDYPDFRLLIAGEGSNSFYKELKFHCEQGDKNKQIEFLGYRSDVYSLMQNATALLVPSIKEGFGFITAEAMLNGCLVLGRNTGGTKEQFDNGVILTGNEIGLRFDNEDELVYLMKKLCDKGIMQYENMIHKAKETVLNLYSSDKNAKSVLDIYNKLI